MLDKGPLLKNLSTGIKCKQKRALNFLVQIETVVPRLNTFFKISDGRCLLFVEVKTWNYVLQSRDRLDKQTVP